MGMSTEWWNIYSCSNLYQMLLNGFRSGQQIMDERMLSRAVKFVFSQWFDDELLNAVQRLWLASVPKKICLVGDSYKTDFLTGSIVTIPDRHFLSWSLKISIPVTCLQFHSLTQWWFRSLAAISGGNFCHTFSPLWLPLDREFFWIFSFLSLALDLSDIHKTLSLLWRPLYIGNKSTKCMKTVLLVITWVSFGHTHNVIVCPNYLFNYICFSHNLFLLSTIWLMSILFIFKQCVHHVFGCKNKIRA